MEGGGGGEWFGEGTGGGVGVVLGDGDAIVGSPRWHDL